VGWKRWLGIGTVFLAVVALIVYGFRPQPVLVEFAKVSRAVLQVTVEEEGKTRVTDRYTVSSPVAGFARRLTLEVGNAVKKGQVLLLLEPPLSNVLDPRGRAEAKARVDSAQASIDAAKDKAKAAAADAGYWQNELARVKKLYTSGDTSKETYDRTLSEAQKSLATRRSAEHTIEVAQSELVAAQAALHFSAARSDGAGEEVAIRAPVSGRVLKIIHKSEGVVNPGEALLEIGNAHSLEVVVELLSADAVRIAPGTRVLFERWGGTLPLDGRVRRVEPVAFTKISALGVEEQRVQVIVDIVSPPELWERLGAGYRVEASFILWEGKDVLQIPSSALFRYGDDWAVFTVKDNVAWRRIVKIGHRNSLAVELLSGLSDGETVIAHPDESMEDHSPVKARG
jgi:HlyD family secretion protein